MRRCAWTAIFVLLALGCQKPAEEKGSLVGTWVFTDPPAEYVAQLTHYCAFEQYFEDGRHLSAWHVAWDTDELVIVQRGRWKQVEDTLKMSSKSGEMQVLRGKQKPFKNQKGSLEFTRKITKVTDKELHYTDSMQGETTAERGERPADLAKIEW